MSWDIFLEAYHELMMLGKDVQQLEKLSRKYCWKQDWNVREILFQQGKAVLVTDLSLHIVFASSNLSKLSGYLPEEVIGKTPKLFQGKDTSNESKAVIRKAIHELKPFAITLLNYSKAGTPYWCNITGEPVFNRKNKPVHFIAFEKIKPHDI